MTESDIVQILVRYSIRRHYQGSSAGSRTVYAVFGKGKQLSAPSDHASTSQARDKMIAADILALAKEKGIA